MPRIELGQGLTSVVLQGGRPIRIGTAADADAAGTLWYGDQHESYLGVPIPTASRVIGVLSVSKAEAQAFSEADEQLLSTIASSMGVALENARLFDETKRLLTETEPAPASWPSSTRSAPRSRSSSTSRRSSTWSGIGSERFSAPRMCQSGSTTLTTNLVSFPYSVEDGRRYTDEPIELGTGLTSRIIESRQPLRVGTEEEAAALGARLTGDPNTPMKQSFLGVPIPAGDRVLGVVSVVLEPPNAFTESHERLLSTLASQWASRSRTRACSTRPSVC